MLEPDQRHIGCVLCLLDLLAATMLVCVERSRDGRAVAHGIGQRDRVLHRKLGARADREMRARLGIAKQHHLVLDPALAADHREIAPHRAVGEQLVAVEKPAKDLRHPIG